MITIIIFNTIKLLNSIIIRVRVCWVWLGLSFFLVSRRRNKKDIIIYFLDSGGLGLIIRSPHPGRRNQGGETECSRDIDRQNQ